MSLAAYTLREQFKSFIEEIDKMPPKKREDLADAPLGRKFNAFLQRARQSSENMDDGAWPTLLTFVQNTTNATYAEIATFAQQIIDLLPQ